MNFASNDKRKYLILQCRYYKGESEPPKTLPEGYDLMWDYESRWVDWTLHESDHLKMIEEDIHTLHLETKEGDKTPLTLKALLCNRYLHWGGYAPLEEELKHFEKWYIDFYQKWKTNRERRADQRKPNLIEKCRFYHGEESCIFEDYAKQCFWNWEKQWVEALADSYLNRDKIKHECTTSNVTYPLRGNGIEKYLTIAEKNNIPRTLMMFFIIEFAKGYQGGFKHEMEEYFDFWLGTYLK